MGAAWCDYDNDGDLDLYVSNYGQPNVLLRNDGGDVFTAITAGALGDNGNGTGVAWADADGDGDLDLYLVNDGQANVLLRNDLSSTSHWLSLDLRGLVSNRSAVGARVRVVAGGISRIREVSGGSGYMSQNSLVLHVGLGTAAVADSVVVSWPSGYVESHHGLPADQRFVIEELSVVAVPDGPAPGPALQLAAAGSNPAALGRSLLRFALPRPARVRLRVYDVQGRLAARVVESHLPAGWHTVDWTGGRAEPLASGIYLAKLDALGETRTLKLALVR
jgi:hypothetical protein